MAAYIFYYNHSSEISLNNSYYEKKMDMPPLSIAFIRIKK